MRFRNRPGRDNRTVFDAVSPGAGSFDAGSFDASSIAAAARAGAGGPPGLTRRRFLAGGATFGAVLGAPLLSSCFGDGGDAPVPPPPAARTLFLDFSHHENFASRDYFLVGGGQRYPLVRVADKPSVLAAARAGNAFLAAVPDAHVTHHVENAVYADDAPSLTYATTGYDAATGAWGMAAVYLQIPASGARHAYERARAITPSGPLPLSARRRAYGVRAAETEQDLLDERVLLDPHAHAAAIVGAHPELCSLETNSAHHIHSNYIDNANGTQELAGALGTPQYGVAMPEPAPGVANPMGWATLTPVLDDTTGKPLRNLRGKNAGYIHYLPTMNVAVAQSAGNTMTGVTSTVVNDTSLGTDVTGIAPKAGDPPNAALAGVMWTRQDGTSFSDASASPAAVGGGTVQMTQKQDPAQYLTRLNASSSTSGATTTVNMTLLNAASRFLGVYLQFFSDADKINPLKLADIPEYTKDQIIPGHDNGLDQPDAMFIGMLGSVVTVMAVPVAPAFMTPSFTLPAGVTSVRVLMSGIGSGANAYPDTLLLGQVMTGIISYGITAFLCAFGAAVTLSAVMSVAVIPYVTALAQELVLIVAAGINNKGVYTSAFWAAQALAMVKFILTALAKAGVGVAVGRLVAAAVPAAAEGAAEDAIPIAGWVMLGISVAVGVANLAETSIEVALSPNTYVWDLGFTHDISVTLTPDLSKNNLFPAAATHYIVTATFDDAIPHRQVLPLTDHSVTSLSVPFPGVPLGGNVDVSVAFIQQALPGQANILLGKGSTGKQPNQPGVAPAIQITQLQFPLGPTTTYRHQQKTAITAAGAHYWNNSLPAPTATSVACDQAGSLCALRDITVRQGTGTQPGYLGYAWQAQNATLQPGCASSAQVDQMGNLNTGADASSGYAVTPCGLPAGGVQLAYDLLGSDGGNFYLDTTVANAWHLRQVVLDGAPQFNPGTGQSWGVLNFLPDALVLHPSGHIVSISNANHKMETLRLPPAAVDDSTALTTLLARTHCGQGARPGLMTQPLTASVAADGTIVVLENGDPNATPPVPTRLQAMTVGGNSKPHFTGQASPYFFELTATPAAAGWTLLDVAVEYTGVIYVLALDPNGASRMDVYLRDQTGTAPLFSTPGVNGGKLTVDFWRSIYTLNNEMIQRDDGAVPGLTEPSVSLWEPCDVGQTCA